MLQGERQNLKEPQLEAGMCQRSCTRQGKQIRKAYYKDYRNREERLNSTGYVTVAGDL